MPPALNLVIRDAGRGDHAAIVHLLAAAFADGAVARWIDPDPVSRHVHSIELFTDVVDAAIGAGIVRIAQEAGDVVAAALWLPHPAPVPCRPPGDSPPGDVALRMAVVDRLLAERHPDDRPHHHLDFLGVRPDRQGCGIGGYLLDDHHATLDATSTPAYLEANDSRNHELYLRHGYTDVGAPVMPPGSAAPIWPMWRQPAPHRHTGTPDGAAR